MLYEEFTEKRIRVGGRTELVPEELLHMSEQLCGFVVAELLSTDELLQLTLFGACRTFDELGLEHIIGVLGWGLE